MAGRAGLGLAQGFMQGYDFMQGIDEREQRMGLRDQQNLRATESHQRQGEQHDFTMDQARNQQEQQRAQQILGKISHGLDLADEEYGFLKQNPQYWPALDPQTDKSLETAKAVMDPNSPVSMRSPETLDALNQMFGHRINRGEGGRKRIDGIYPGRAPGTVAFSVEVEGEDGKKYRAPMTTNRGTQGDDEVLQTPVEDVLGQVKGYDMLRQTMQSPQAQAQAQKVLMALTGKTPERSSAYRQTQELVGLGLDPEQARNQAYGIKSPERYGNAFQHEQLGWVQRGPDGQLKQLKGADNDRYGQPFQHESLGWVQQGPDGKLYQYDPEKGGMAGGASDGTGGLDSSVMSQIQQTSRNFHGTFNPDGTFMGIPQGAREKYTMAMERAQQLVQSGMPVFEATNLANLSVGEPLTEDEARQLATQEAESEVTGWFQGDKRDQYVETRTQELLQESQQAGQRYQQIMGGGQQQGMNSPGQQHAMQRPQQQQPAPRQAPQTDAPADAQQRAAQVRADYKAGKISREQAVNELRKLGFE